jgi:hypothetical protein
LIASVLQGDANAGTGPLAIEKLVLRHPGLAAVSFFAV